MTFSPIDRGLAAELIEAVGAGPGDGAVALAERLPERVLCGSTAKLRAVREGRVPPGADVEGLARTIVDVERARRAAPPAESPAWSCWVLAPLLAVLVEAAGMGTAKVVALRRIDEGPNVAPVDFHSSVVVEADGRQVVCDPYFGLGVELPHDPGAVATSGPGPAVGDVVAGAGGRWELGVRLARWDEPFRYRLVAPDLDAGDVHALCAISVQHSGVPSRPYARLHRDGAVFEAQELGPGGFAAQRWSDDGVDRVEVDTWREAADAFGTWTGVRPT